jgi:DNA-binding transcriptional MerR regulator
MEIKTQLNKPYTDEERINFIIEQNRKNGYEIKETETALEAWGYTEEEKQQQEAERIANLHLTRGDVFRGLLLAKGITRAEIRGIIEAMPEVTPQEKIAKEYALIDFDEALEFYRGVALIDTLGEQLGITSEQMTKFFETKDWHELVETEED